MAKTIITIDGGVATGTTTLAKKLALELGIPRIDSGSIYRALSFLVLTSNIDPEDSVACSKLAEQAKFEMPEGEVIAINNLKVIDRLHTAEVDQIVAKVAAHQGVRAAVKEVQRDFAAKAGAVVDGRDTGTVVFPAASLKLFLTCDDQEAARRRSSADGRRVTIKEVRDRNQADREHKYGALAKASDAIEIDTTHISAEKMIKIALDLLARRSNEHTRK